MGLFSSLFKKKEPEIRKAHVYANQVQEWFDNKSDILIRNIEDSIEEDFDKINEHISVIKQKAAELEEARLKNENIPERAITIMQGNRNAYLNAVRNLAGRIKTPSKISFESVSEFVSDFEDSIVTFTKTSQKSFMVLQEFFAHESKDIAQHIRDIDLIVRGLVDNDYRKVSTILANIKQLNEVLKKKDTASSMKEEYDKEKLDLVHSIDETNAGMDELKKGRDYNLLKESEAKKDKLHHKLKDIENGLSELFLPIEKPLKKYAKVSMDHEKLIQSYLKSPMHALLEDKGFAILSVLASMKGSLEKDELGIKDKQKEKAIQSIGAFSREILKGFSDDYHKVREEVSEEEKRLKMNMAVQKQNELDYKLSHLNDKLKRVNENIDKLSKFMEKPEDKEIIDKLRADILEVLHIDLDIRQVPNEGA